MLEVSNAPPLKTQLYAISWAEKPLYVLHVNGRMTRLTAQTAALSTETEETTHCLGLFQARWTLRVGRSPREKILSTKRRYPEI